jgi:glycosyltransferase involved in cell wall biosynthesis
MGLHCHRVCATIGGLVVRSLDESIKHLGKASAIAVPNKTWFDEYLKKEIKNVKFFLIPNGVDINKFTPKLKSNNEFIVGWAGNDRPDRARIKRIDELRRVCNKQGIILLEQGRSSQIDHAKMPAFYQQLDLYVNLSITEGSNNCVLEAAACGIPVLGTKVGNLPELEAAGAFTVDYDLCDLTEKLLYIRNLKNRHQIGEILRNEIVKNYSNDLMAIRYKEMFDHSLSLDIT